MCKEEGHDARTCPDNGGSGRKATDQNGSGVTKRGRKRKVNEPAEILSEQQLPVITISAEIVENSDADESITEEALPLDEQELDPAILEEMEGGGSAENGVPEAQMWEQFVIQPHPELETRNQGLTQAPFAPAAPKISQGAKNIPPEVTSPAQYLDLLFTDIILERFCNSTNSYVSAQPKPAWLPENNLTPAELKKYFGLCLYMGIPATFLCIAAAMKSVHLMFQQPFTQC